MMAKCQYIQYDEGSGKYLVAPKLDLIKTATDLKQPRVHVEGPFHLFPTLDQFIVADITSAGTFDKQLEYVPAGRPAVYSG